MTINFYLNRRENQDENIIFCYIRGFVKGETIVLHTGERINPKHWDKAKQRVIAKGKNKYYGALEINSYLDAFRREIEKTVRQILLENPLAEYDVICSTIKQRFNRTQNYNNFFETFDDYVDLKKTALAKNSVNKFNTLKKHLEDFEKKTKYELTFHSINLLFFDKFVTYLRQEKNHTDNTVAKLVTTFKTFMTWATERKINTNLEYKKFKVKEIPIEVIYLTFSELMTLYNYNFNSDKLSNVRDIFCFCCFTGARFSDVHKIQWNEIKNNTWSFRAQKTKGIIEVPLNKYALSILQKYKDNPKPLPTLSNQKCNDYLKEACKLAEIEEPVSQIRYRGNEKIEEIFQKHEKISSHTARRTFIILSLEQGMRPETVMSITGHTDYKTFKKYITIASKVKKSELYKAWNSNPK